MKRKVKAQLLLRMTDRDEYLELTPEQQATYNIAEKEGVIQLNEMGDDQRQQIVATTRVTSG